MHTRAPKHPRSHAPLTNSCTCRATNSATKEAAKRANRILSSIIACWTRTCKHPGPYNYLQQPGAGSGAARKQCLLVSASGCDPFCRWLLMEATPVRRARHKPTNLQVRGRTSCCRTRLHKHSHNSPKRTCSPTPNRRRGQTCQQEVMKQLLPSCMSLAGRPNSCDRQPGPALTPFGTTAFVPGCSFILSPRESCAVHALTSVAQGRGPASDSVGGGWLPGYSG